LSKGRSSGLVRLGCEDGELRVVPPTDDIRLATMGVQYAGDVA
jgi:hypothetical protein